MKTNRCSFLRPAWATTVVVALILCGLAVTAQAQRREPPPLPDGVTLKEVTIWSEGTRLAADIYAPADMKEGDKLPTILFCNGWGGTKRGCRRIGIKFAEAGYISVAIDYRGWGKSDSIVVIKGESPKPDENGEATIRVQMIREVVDPLNEAEDIRHALDFLQAEPGVDTSRIGLWGTSYGGGLVVWTAAHDDRVACVVSQVPGMGVMPEEWAAMGRQRAIEQARGDTEPIPQGTDAVPGLRGTPNAAKMLYYDAVKVADRVNVPTLIIDAENEELMNRMEHGKAVYEIIKAKGNVPTKYVVMKGITHYGIYREAYEESSNIQLEWFDKHLKGKK